MYLINEKDNNIEPIKEITFKSAGFKERKNLQEWIAKSPELLDKKGLLIIQKEFSGFDDTNERIDLLAIDKVGNLVVIENKLDDTGKDVTWQALKYASYCSSLNADGIKDIFNDYLRKYDIGGNAEEKLEEFLGEDYQEKLKAGTKQRIILVAGEFRKEVTSTVMWLINFGLKIQCFKVTPYKFGEKLLLDCDQILPPPETEDYMIKVAVKNREELAGEEELENRYSIRLDFWAQFLKEINATPNNYCANISPSKEGWMGIALGITGISMNFVVSRDYARAEIMINRGGGSPEKNKEAFDYFFKMKDKIEKDFGGKLIWERMDDRVTSRIKTQLDGVNLFNQDDWKKMDAYLIEAGTRLRNAFMPPVEQFKMKSRV